MKIKILLADDHKIIKDGLRALIGNEEDMEVVVDALNGRRSACGSVLENVMGPRQSTVGSGNPRWMGFHSLATEPDGWFAQALDNPDCLDGTGSQIDATGTYHGAWVISTTDPVTALRLENYGNSGECFFDQATSTYWMDPAHFEGMSRNEIEQWLTENPSWHWANHAEVWALADRLTVDDVPLVDIMGEPQFLSPGLIPRWMGYYNLGEEGLVVSLQAGGDLLLPFPGLTGFQSGDGPWSPGAWVITKDIPTPAENKSWGTLKAMFR